MLLLSWFYPLSFHVDWSTCFNNIQIETLICSLQEIVRLMHAVQMFSLTSIRYQQDTGKKTLHFKAHKHWIRNFSEMIQKNIKVTALRSTYREDVFCQWRSFRSLHVSVEWTKFYQSSIKLLEEIICCSCFKLHVITLFS